MCDGGDSGAARGRVVAAMAPCRSCKTGRMELGRRRRQVRSADEMTRRVLQAIAGAAHGGAETFFIRLAAALQRAGEPQRVLIRRHSRRAKDLRAAGVGVGELAFGGIFDVATRLAFGREIAAWRPDIVLTWMSRATRMCPTGDFVHVGRLGGYYDLKYYRRCDHLIGNTRAIVDYAVREGWPPERAHYLPNFVPDPRGLPTGPAPQRPHGAPLALALGRLHPNKGFDLLLDALGLTDDGRSGLLVPWPGQPGGGSEALATAIASVALDPSFRARLAQGGREAYEAEFTEPAVVARYRDFFDGLAG